jgi:GNAT superfamily N-acetyltransferase
MSSFSKVRSATADDLDEILALWSHFIRTHSTNPAYRNLPRGALDLRRELYLKRIEAPDSEVFVVERPDGGLDGMITCFVEENLPYLRPRFYCRLQTPFVRAAARGRGNLKKLLNEAYRWARERELIEVRLYTAADNLLANALADELGFTAIEVVRRRPIDWSMPPPEHPE